MRHDIFNSFIILGIIHDILDTHILQSEHLSEHVGANSGILGPWCSSPSIILSNPFFLLFQLFLEHLNILEPHAPLDHLSLFNFFQYLILFCVCPLFVSVLISQTESDLEIVFDIFVVFSFIGEKKGNNFFEEFGLGLYAVDLCFVTLYEIGWGKGIVEAGSLSHQICHNLHNPLLL